MMPEGTEIGFNNTDAEGNPALVINQPINFGLEYVWHCHILSHEEMDMMRPVSVSLPPNAPDGLAWTTSANCGTTNLTLTWNDNSLDETAFVVQRDDGTEAWVDVRGTDVSPLDEVNTKGIRLFTDTFAWDGTTYSYRVVAQNMVGYGREFMSVTTESVSEVMTVDPNLLCYGNIAPDPLDITVDALDLAAFAADFGRADCTTGGCPGDIQPTCAPDGVVDGLDLFALSQEFGRTDCPNGP